MLFFYSKSLWLLSKSLCTHQDNIHGHSVMLQWNIHFIVKFRHKAATCPRALLSFSAHWSVDYSWPLLYLEPTGDHRGKHHLGESFPSCKSTIMATGMEAALHWCLDAFYMGCVTTKTEQWCPKQTPQMCVQLIRFPEFCTARESCTSVSFLMEITTSKGNSLADSLDFSG